MLKQAIAAAKALDCNTVVFSAGLIFCCNEQETTYVGPQIRLNGPLMLIADGEDYDSVQMKSVDIGGNYTLMRLK